MGQADFENLLKEAIGLDAASVGSAAIERAVHLRMEALGLKRSDDYWRKLCSLKQERQEFIEAVVVPETWFFRDPDAFASLVRVVNEELRTSVPLRPLRLLSVPCSSGEEPYSMAMSLLEGGLAPQPWGAQRAAYMEITRFAARTWLSASAFFSVRRTVTL
jgi:chemotaxis protein methyltransferase WspC